MKGDGAGAAPVRWIAGCHWRAFGPPVPCEGPACKTLAAEPCRQWHPTPNDAGERWRLSPCRTRRLTMPCRFICLALALACATSAGCGDATPIDSMTLYSLDGTDRETKPAGEMFHEYPVL